MTGRHTALIAIAAAVSALASSARAQDSAETLFLGNCSACHQASGLGVPGAFPALAGDKFVLGDPGALASLVLKGRGGMPAYKVDLDDATIATILTYVRASWGNKASPVTTAMVAAARAKTGDTAARGLQTH
jgi:mono/diheme cytochrome c family protein